MDEVIRICAQCQKDFPDVNKAVGDAERRGVKFTHGLCAGHFIKQMREMGVDDAVIKNMLESSKQPPPLTLEKHPELVQKYSQGIFGDEQSKEASALVERFRKIANIKSSRRPSTL